MKIKKNIKKIISAIFSKQLVLEKKMLVGVELKTVKGTIRPNPDQDDAWFYELAKHHATIFDIGANVGYTALIAMLLHKHRRYVLVDPNPLALIDASKNLLLNNFGSNATFFTGFVSDVIGDNVKFYTVGTGAAGSMYKSHAKTAAKLDNWFMVETTTIDNLVDYYGLHPDLVKIDVEGAESFVLNGSKVLAKKSTTTFFVEMHATDEVSMESNGNLILDWCSDCNYSAWYLAEMTQMVNSKLIENRGKCHLLLLPKGKSLPKYLNGIKQGANLPNTIK